MTRSLRAELLKLRRPSIRYGAGGAAVAFALLATVVTFVTAKVKSPRVLDVAATLTTSLSQLTGSGGLARGFTIAAGVLGLLVFVLFMTSVTSEYGLGTIRVMLTRQPARVRLLAGKLLALLGCVAAAPGLVFDAIAAGGTAAASYQRALILSLAFTAVALTIGAASFLRRDVST